MNNVLIAMRVVTNLNGELLVSLYATGNGCMVAVDLGDDTEHRIVFRRHELSEAVVCYCEVGLVKIGQEVPDWMRGSFEVDEDVLRPDLLDEGLLNRIVEHTGRVAA